MFSDKENGQAQVLILGVGNILLSDEGLGVRIVERLQNEYQIPQGVEILDGGTSGMDLLPYLEERKHLFIIDVINNEADEPGTFFKIDLKNRPGYFHQKITPHQLGLSDVLAILDMTDKRPQNIMLLGIKPKAIETGLELSPEVYEKSEELLQNLIQELKALGYHITPKQ